MNTPAPPNSRRPGKLALAINPAASFGRLPNAGDQAAAFFRAAGTDVVVLQDVSFETLRKRVNQAVDAGIEALVVVGGDGMVNLAVNALAGTDVPLGIVPAGTGNDVARSLGLPLEDIAAACRVVLDALGAGGRRIDLARTTSASGVAYFAGVLSAGFDAAVNERANSWRWPRGRNRYNLAMIRELASFRPIDYVVTADGQQWHQRAMLMSVANGQSIGGGMRITPDAAADDGELDLFVVKPLSRLAFLAVFPKVFTGRHTGHPAVGIQRAKRVRLEATGVSAYADGERIAELPVEVEVVPGGLRVLA
ncbi:diacylglycerol/lipid kinase family protein [Paenarthrobacter sp. NPDC089714]|uniref:diacylglycerol/lipid kinase family protein n=1 Tax=Paenarthrobacter sp. NPDC089714 TaxID=3364377 RepID=UPI0038032575